MLKGEQVILVKKSTFNILKKIKRKHGISIKKIRQAINQFYIHTFIVFVCKAESKMLHKATTFSTKEYDSLEYSEYTPYTLQKSGIKNKTLNQTAKKQLLENKQSVVSNRSFVPWVSNQTLSNIFLLSSAPLLVCGYCYANYNQINPVQTVFCKFLVQTIVHETILICKNNHTTGFSNQQLKIVIFRAIFAALHTYFLILAQEYLPLTAVLTINGSGIVILYFVIQTINKKTIYSQKLKGIVCCIFGLCFIIAAYTVYPLMFGLNHQKKSYIHYQDMTFLSRVVVCSLLLVWVIISAVSLLYGATKSNLSVSKTIQIHSIVGLFVFSIFYQSFDFSRQLDKFFKASLVSGLLFCISNYLFSWGMYLSSKKGLSSFLNQLTIVISYLVSICCLNERPNALQIIGSLLMISSIYFILIKE